MVNNTAIRSVAVLALSALTGLVGAVNTTYHNPILPGWNSDPTCTFVAELDNTFFCSSSSFLIFPGIPVYASKDLVNWRHASNALNRDTQIPQMYQNGESEEGIWASTLRYREGVFYLVTSYNSYVKWEPKILVFTTTDPYDDSAWSDPFRLDNPTSSIDPDLFWDDDGKIYLTLSGGSWVSEIDLKSGTALDTFEVWNGTGNPYPEGPHYYKKDGYYYLLIGEGGTETNHSATIARAKDIRGPYESDSANPIMTAKNTDHYFQTVGHADLFQDGSGNWWAVALSTRSGPEWKTYPMGRELILAPARWDEGGWPVVDPVFGNMSGPLPPVNKDVPGDGPWTDAPDVVDFLPGSALPRNFVHWRPPRADQFAISPPESPNSLRISPSRVNLTGDDFQDPKFDGLAFVARKQSATVFNFTVDISFNPSVAGEEAGVSLFLTQFQHADLSIVGLGSKCANKTGLVPYLQFQAETSGNPTATLPVPATKKIPTAWLGGKIRLSVAATDSNTFVLSAASVAKPDEAIVMGHVNADFVSGGTGRFTGSLVGAYATRNGGTGLTPAYFSRWRYTPIAQQIYANESVPQW